MTEKEVKKAPLTQTEAKIRKEILTAEDNKTYNVNYDLTLTIRRSTDKIKDEKHDFEGYLVLTLDYYKKELTNQNLFLNFVGEVNKMLINDKEMSFKYEKHQLFIDVSQLIKGNNKIEILFSGDYNHDGVGLHHYIDPSDKKEYLYTQFEPFDCNRLFPCFDQPDIKAIMKLQVIAPKEWIVLGNAYEKTITDVKTKEDIKMPEFTLNHLIMDHNILTKDYHFYTFESTPKISSYLYALCAGPYYCHENKTPFDVKLRLFCRESLKDCGEPNEIFRITMEGMKFYSQYFGCPFPFGKYDQIFCPEYNMGAMENVGLITLNELYCWKDKPRQISRENFCNTILHELAHMWFGNMVTMKWWDNLWLNESFATFISHLCMAVNPEINKDYHYSWVLFAKFKGYAFSADQLMTTHPIMGEIKDTEQAETEFDSIVYEKGSSMVKQMYYYIGDETFSKGLKNYFAKYKWDNTIFDDFIDKMVEASEGKLSDLKEKCKEWFQKAGLNEISLNIEKDQNNKISKFIIKQNPCLKEFDNKIKIITDFLFVYDNKFEKTKVFEKQVIEPKEETIFNNFIGEEMPQFVFLNYNDWAYIKINVSHEDAKFLKENILNLKDTLSKTIINRMMFDSMRDSKICAFEFLDYSINAIKEEKQPNNFSDLLQYMSSAATFYLPLKYVKEYKEKIFSLLKDLLSKRLSEIHYDFDIIKTIISYLIRHCCNEDHILYLIELLNLDPKILGQNLRFDILKKVYMSTNISLEDKEYLLKNEIERDKNSERSITAKLATNARLPDPENKKKLWEKITTKCNSESLVNMQEIMYNFAPLEQLDLTKDYLRNKFFEVVPEIAKNNESFYLQAFINSMSPENYCDDEEILGKMRDLLEKIKDLSTVSKYVKESYDLMLRAKKAHQLCEDYLKNNK